MATNVSRSYPLILLLLFMLFFHSISLSPNGEQSKPFEFLKHFHGTHKGDKVQGLGVLKKVPQKIWVPKLSSPSQYSPDINNGKTSMRSGKKNHVQCSGSSFIHTVAHYNFLLGWPRWPASKTHLTYAFLSRADVLGPPCAQAFENWDSVTHFTFEEIQNYDVADVKISFQIGNHGDGAGAFDGPHGVLAHSFAPDDRRVHFDGQDLWSMIPLPGAFDSETVGSHEIWCIS